MNLHQPLHVLPGVGPKSAEKYAKLGIENLQDLLLYFPFRYEDFKTKQVLELEDGEKAVLSGQVVTPASVQYYGFKRNRLRFSLKQGEVVFAVNFFNQPYLASHYHQMPFFLLYYNTLILIFIRYRSDCPQN